MRHRFYSLCPYFAMFPETFVDKWIEELTRPGDLVLDPFCGRGTTALSALLLGRRAVSSDVNDVAFCLTKAKTDPPSLSALRSRLTMLERNYRPRAWSTRTNETSEFFTWAYASSVLSQLRYLRSVLNWKASRTDAMIAALVLGSLHGEMDKSQSYFSNQMPRTISTKPAYSVRFWRKRRLRPPERDVFTILRGRASFRYESPVPDGEAWTFQHDVRRLPRAISALKPPVRCVITSPPYLDVTNFEEDQWLRLWFLGGPPVPTVGRLSRDDRHSNPDRYWRFIGDMWRALGQIMARKGNAVIRLGSTRMDPGVLARLLKASSKLSGRKVELVSSEISQVARRQTDNFRPGSIGCSVEVDCHFRFRD